MLNHLQELLISVVIACVFIGVAFKIVSLRSGASLIGHKTNRIQSIVTKKTLQETLKSLVSFARMSGCKISAMDESNHQMVLETSTKDMIFSWGFYFPITVSQQNDTTLVEVGIKSKLTQVGPFVSYYHVKFANKIRKALLAQS